MNDAPSHQFQRPKKSALLRFRCSSDLRLRLIRMASMKEKDYSDVLRDALLDVVTRFEQSVRGA